MPLNIRIQWNAGTACVSECVLKTLACRGLRVGRGKSSSKGVKVAEFAAGTVSATTRFSFLGKNFPSRPGCLTEILSIPRFIRNGKVAQRASFWAGHLADIHTDIRTDVRTENYSPHRPELAKIRFFFVRTSLTWRRGCPWPGPSEKL